jgi:hypothetical protein
MALQPNAKAVYPYCSIEIFVKFLILYAGEDIL